jgi:molybdenum cofactor biosynthesis enzyme MoaA
MSKKCNLTHVGVSINGSYSKLHPCCIFKEQKRKKELPFELETIPSIFEVDTLNNLHFLPPYKRIQSKLDHGMKIPQCQRCWVHENAGIESRREFSNSQLPFNKLKHGFVQDLEIALDFTCNMMCRMCDPSFSSKWGTAQTVLKQYKKNNIGDVFDAKIYKKYQDQFYKVFDNTSFKHVHEIKIQGGEPLLAKNFEWFLDKLYNEAEDPTKVNLSIFTNGSIFPNKKILNKIENFNSRIIFSLDAYGDLATVIRYGVEWSDVEKSLLKWSNWAKNNSTKLATNTTLSILNVNMIDPLVDFCNSINITASFNGLHQPSYYSMYQLPLSIRSKWKDSKKTVGDEHNSFDRLLLADIKQQPEFERFLKATEILDAYQKVSFKQANPEMHDIVVSLQ